MKALVVLKYNGFNEMPSSFIVRWLKIIVGWLFLIFVESVVASFGVYNALQFSAKSVCNAFLIILIALALYLF